MPTFSDYLKSLPLYLLPHHLISRIIFFLTRLQGHYIYLFIDLFVKVFKIDLSEAKISNSKDFASFNDFFTRELKDNARQIDYSENVIISPVDAHVSQIGKIDDNRIFQAKGHHYTLQQLLANNLCLCEQFRNGKFATLYLSPSDYHRIHMPYEGKLKKMTYVPGRLFSVAAHTVRVVPALFARNERLICHFSSSVGDFVMILVGAINVAAIETVWAGLVTPPTSKDIKEWDYEKQDIVLKKGEEMGRFNMGSTVILLYQDQISWDASLQENARVLLGEAIAVKN